MSSSSHPQKQPKNGAQVAESFSKVIQCWFNFYIKCFLFTKLIWDALWTLMQRLAFIARPRRRCGQVINDSPCWCRGPCAGQIAIRTAPLMLPGRQELNCVATHRVKTSVMTQSCQGQCTSPLPNIHCSISCSCCYWCRSCSSNSCYHFFMSSFFFTSFFSPSLSILLSSSPYWCQRLTRMKGCLFLLP